MSNPPISSSCAPTFLLAAALLPFVIASFFLVSDAGQAVAKEAGYYPLPKNLR